MVDLAIIGGSGLTRLESLEITRKEVRHTPFGEPSAPFTYGRLEGREVVFLPRHGAGHTIPPHRINYRANIWALHHIGVERVIGVAAVGGITQEMAPGRLVVPDQIIDYTYGREHTFFEQDLTEVTHVDFTDPYCPELREALVHGGALAKVGVVDHGTYGATQGPRLESRAEVSRLERDGCDLVGMTGMPEAALAAELGLEYACIAVSVNWAAGIGTGGIHDEIRESIERGMFKVQGTLARFLAGAAT